MRDFERTRLMHAVLDGEATPDEARELERVLAADPAARAEYADLRFLFEGLSRVPKAFPPEGLVAAVMASVPRRPAPADHSSQLFMQSRVISKSSMEAREENPGRSTVHRVSPRGTYLREQSMSEQKSGFGRRNLWIGGGIAAVAALFAVSYVTNFPPSGQDTAGTIVPAQRYLAPQNTADDVKLGNQSATQPILLTQTDAANSAADSAAKSAADSAADSAAKSAADSAAKSAADSAAKSAADSAAKNAAYSAAKSAADSAAKNAADSAARSTANSMAK